MTIRKVLIMMEDSSIASGIESLLSEESNLAVESTNISEGNQFKEIIDRVLPDVIILDETMLTSRQFCLCESLISISNLKIIVLSFQVNQMNVFNRYDVTISNYQDLISAIHNS